MTTNGMYAPAIPHWFATFLATYGRGIGKLVVDRLESGRALGVDGRYDQQPCLCEMYHERFEAYCRVVVTTAELSRRGFSVAKQRLQQARRMPASPISLLDSPGNSAADWSLGPHQVEDTHLLTDEEIQAEQEIECNLELTVAIGECSACPSVHGVPFMELTCNK
eukprot:TRINITY_DN46374_c0_g1_i2.p1 TRINITY_DN46374_c0_g1~~TRINITY_DN46374_c0_g1_i2.p1  ORF type:complete len:165 (+),score=30.14 TRINITY_DN46374_c0_g1_i2:227-721(+)